MTFSFSGFLTSKLLFMLFTWALALAVSFGLRIWGEHHSDPLNIRFYLVTSLLLGPSIVLGIWIPFSKFGDSDS